MIYSLLYNGDFKAKRPTDSDPAAGVMDQVKGKQADLEEEKKLGHEG